MFYDSSCFEGMTKYFMNNNNNNNKLLKRRGSLLFRYQQSN